MNEPNVPGTAIALAAEDLIAVLQHSIFPGAKRESVLMVIGYCKAAGLDPIQKPVHIVPMSVKTDKVKPNGDAIYEYRDVVMPGVNLYRVQAAESGMYYGMSEPEFGPDTQLMVNAEEGRVPLSGFTYPEWCKITVHRLMPNGDKAAFTAIEYWLENYATKSRGSEVPNDMWRKRPRGQLAKCTEAQALRKGFPERTGAPTAEEMAGKSLEDPDVIEHAPPAPRKEPQRRSAAKATKEQMPEAARTGAPTRGATSSAPAVSDFVGERRWIESKVQELGFDLAPILADAGIASLDALNQEAFIKIKAALAR